MVLQPHHPTWLRDVSILALTQAIADQSGLSAKSHPKNQTIHLLLLLQFHPATM